MGRRMTNDQGPMTKERLHGISPLVIEIWTLVILQISQAEHLPQVTSKMSHSSRPQP